MPEEITELRIIFCEAEPLRKELIAAAFTRSAYSHPPCFVSSLSEAILNLHPDGVTVLFLPAACGSLAECAGELSRSGAGSIVLIALTSGNGEQELLEAIRDGADDAISGEQNQLARYPDVAARAVARRTSLLRISEILDWMPDPILLTDGTNRVLAANSAFTDRFGKQPAHGPAILPVDLVGDVQDPTSPPETALAGETYRVDRFPIYQKGRSFMVHLFRNLAGVRQLESRLRRAERLATIGALVSGVAHDINNPLTGTIAYAELLDLQVSEPGAKQDLRKIVESADRCKKILDNLLSFARDRPPAKSFESLNDLIDRTIDLLGYRLRSRGISIARDYDRLPAVFVDAQQLQQVILNLLENAEQALSAVNRTPAEITFSTRYRKEDRFVILRISDDGPGIPEDFAEHIFEPFFNLKQAGAGGIELSQARSIIREQGGTISAENNPAGGAVFTVELPTGAE